MEDRSNCTWTASTDRRSDHCLFPPREDGTNGRRRQRPSPGLQVHTTSTFYFEATLPDSSLTSTIGSSVRKASSTRNPEAPKAFMAAWNETKGMKWVH